MAMRTNRQGRTDRTGMGWGLGIGAAVGALAAWVTTDLNKPDSTIRRWIEIGRRRRERARLEREVERAVDEAAAVGEEIIDNARRATHLPPDEMPI